MGLPESSGRFDLSVFIFEVSSFVAFLSLFLAFPFNYFLIAAFFMINFLNNLDVSAIFLVCFTSFP